MLDIRHFDYGAQPQARADLHAQLLADPEWAGKNYNELTVEFGEAIVATLGSLTTRMWRGQNTLGDAIIDFSSQASPDNSSVFVANSTVLETGGLDMGNLQRWRERLKDGEEDRPIRFDLLGQDPGLDGEPRRAVSIWFDGTRYGLVRRGRTFEYPVPGAAPVPASVTDSWSVWDYNADKRRQRIAEREHLRANIEEEIFGLDSSLYSEQLAKILCRIGMLHSDRFKIKEEARIIEETGKEWGQVSYREILDRKALGINEFNPGERMRYFDLLDAHTSEMVDETQRALVRFWFVTRGEREAYRDHEEPEASVRQRLNDLLAAEVQRTNGAGIWNVVRMRGHLLSVFDDEAADYTKRFTGYFAGQSFQMPKTESDIYAITEYPELNHDRRYASLPVAVALAKNEPPFDLLERLRQQRRLAEDAWATDDAEETASLEAQVEDLVDDTMSEYDGYLTQLDAATDGAEIETSARLGLPRRIDERAMLIEGILLARHIAALADAE